MAAPVSSSSPLTDSYAAGLIDGEGWLGISHVKPADTYTIRVQVAMVTKGSTVLARMQRVYGGRITQRPPETERNAEKDVWVLDGQQASDFIAAIRPALLLKADQADCCLELWRSILESRKEKGRFHWDDSLRRHARHLMLRVQEGNQRGPQENPTPPLRGQEVLAEHRWGEWWDPEASLFGPVPFAGPFPMAGRMVAGRIYATPTASPTTLTSSSLLATPNRRDYKGSPSDAWQGQASLPRDVERLVASKSPLLPTPAVNDMGEGKTVEKWDEWTAVQKAKHGNGNGHGPSLAIEALRLLPTPNASDWKRDDDPADAQRKSPGLTTVSVHFPQEML